MSRIASRKVCSAENIVSNLLFCLLKLTCVRRAVDEILDGVPEPYDSDETDALLPQHRQTQDEKDDSHKAFVRWSIYINLVLVRGSIAISRQGAYVYKLLEYPPTGWESYGGASLQLGIVDCICNRFCNGLAQHHYSLWRISPHRTERLGVNVYVPRRKTTDGTYGNCYIQRLYDFEVCNSPLSEPSTALLTVVNPVLSKSSLNPARGYSKGMRSQWKFLFRVLLS